MMGGTPARANSIAASVVNPSTNGDVVHVTADRIGRFLSSSDPPATAWAIFMANAASSLRYVVPLVMCFWQLLNDASEVKIYKELEPWISSKIEKDEVILQLPDIKPNVEVPVVEIFLK